MATWNDPRTWSVGEIVTAAQLNAQLRDNLTVLNPALIQPVFDGGGAAISTDAHLDFLADVDLTLDQWSIVADTDLGLLEFDIRTKPADTDFDGTFASSDSIVSTDDAILLDSDGFNSSSALTGWSPSITSPRIVRFKVLRSARVQKATLAMKASRD